MKADTTELKKYMNMLKNYPKEAEVSVKKILDHLAFTARANDIKNVSQSMVIRNKGFINSSILYQPAKRGPISGMFSVEGSIKRERFSGWQEQETGKKIEKKYMPTKQARGGSWTNRVKANSKINSFSKLYKSSQFSGSTSKSKFMFMMRILGSRGGGYLHIEQSMQTANGSLIKGIYRFTPHKKKTKSRETTYSSIRRIQNLENIPQPKMNQWHTRGINDTLRENNVVKIWGDELIRILKKNGFTPS